MKIQLRSLIVHTRRTTEQIDFSEIVTFLYGPVSTGKSTVARLIDYCLGGSLERTPALQKEFVSAELSVVLGNYECKLERAADDNQSVRVTWSGPGGDIGSVNAPFVARNAPLLDAEVYNLSDLVFHLCGVTPIKVRRARRDPDSPLIRLSIRDLWWYCYLEQTHLDSSFFHFEDTNRGRKSQDVMRFFTGLHSEHLSQLEEELSRITDEQRSKRAAVQQIRSFMERFELGSEQDITAQLRAMEENLGEAETKRAELENTRTAQTHPTDALRVDLRHWSAEIEGIRQAIADSKETIAEQKALRAELITTKTKAERTSLARNILDKVQYQHCPECGLDISGRIDSPENCRLCGSARVYDESAQQMEMEALRRDLNERIDQITDSIARREHELHQTERQLVQAQERKSSLDRQLQEELARYDSAFVESIRTVEREIATLRERISSLQRLQKLPEAIDELEESAGSLEGNIDRLRTLIDEEKKNLRHADANIAAIAAEFKRIMISISFPGVAEEDEVIIDPRNWKPTVVHDNQPWSFWDTGSGGKKTLFNVCYALALHIVAREREMPVPSVLIIDSPTKNISEDENPELVHSLYSEIYRLARDQDGHRLQFLLIDSDLVRPSADLPGFSERRMAGEPEAPSLIPYYDGP